jgi:hypothetical protein
MAALAVLAAMAVVVGIKEPAAVIVLVRALLVLLEHLVAVPVEMALRDVEVTDQAAALVEAAVAQLVVLADTLRTTHLIVAVDILLHRGAVVAEVVMAQQATQAIAAIAVLQVIAVLRVILAEQEQAAP